MNERLKEFLDFKKHTLKAFIFLFILIVLNVLMWNVFFQNINIPFYIPIIIIIATFVLIYTLLTRTKYKLKAESMFKYIFKVDKDALKYLGVVYLIFFPLIFGFYAIIDLIINSLKNIPDTALEIILIISGVVIAILLTLLIIGLVEWVIAKLNAKEVEQEPPKEIPIEPIFEDVKVPLEVYYEEDDGTQKTNLLPPKEQKELIKGLKKKIKKK